MSDIAILVFAASLAVPPAQTDCGFPGVAVHYSNAIDADSACEGVRRTYGYMLGGLGLKAPERLVITFKDTVLFPAARPPVQVVGIYDRSNRAIEMTSFASPWLHLPERTLFGRGYDMELHASVVAHEVAHAVTKANYRIAVPGHAPDEYIAYAVQWHTMEPETRQRILARYPDLAFERDDQINDLVHYAEPHAFGIKSYRHFLARGEGFIRDILDGRYQSFVPLM